MADYTQPSGEEKQKPLNDLDKPKPGEEELVDWVQFEREPNLVPYFMQGDDPGSPGRRFLSNLAKQVCEDTKRGIDSAEEYRTRRQQLIRLMTGFLPKKTFPFEGCANAHQPLLFERILRLWSNIYKEIFMERSAWFSVTPVGPDDMETAEILTLHGLWQFRNEIVDWFSQMDMAGMEFFTVGSVFCYSYRDTINNVNRHDILNCDEFFFPYIERTNYIDMRDVPWKTRLVKKYRNELMDMGDSGEWDAAQVDAVLKHNPPAWSFTDQKVREIGAKAEGLVAPSEDPFAPYEFYEYHGWARMPGGKRMRPIVAVVSTDKQIVTRLYIREKDDWRDAMRHERQTAELGQYQQDQMAFQQTQQATQQFGEQVQASPELDPEEKGMLAEGIAAEPLQPPAAPTWLADSPDGQPAPIKRVPIEPFSHGRCVRNPFGAYGMSFGTILGSLNELVDEGLNRFYDSATLANIQGYIYKQGLDLGGGKNVAFAPGKWIEAKNIPGDKLQDVIYELRASNANPQLLDIVRIAEENADSSVAAPGVLSGEPGKSGETFRGIATRMSRASGQLTVAGRKFIDFVENILRNNAELNAIYLDDKEIVQVGNHFIEARKYSMMQGPGGMMMPKPQVEISAEMYRRNYQVEFSADVQFTTQDQKIAHHDEVLQMIIQLPPLQGMAGFIYGALKGALSARGMTDLIPLLGPPPPAPDLPMGTPPPAPAGVGPPGAPGQPGPGGGGPPGLPPEAQGPIQGPRPQ